jgi:hypothetical protein
MKLLTILFAILIIIILWAFSAAYAAYGQGVTPLRATFTPRPYVTPAPTTAPSYPAPAADYPAPASHGRDMPTVRDIWEEWFGSR